MDKSWQISHFYPALKNYRDDFTSHKTQFRGEFPATHTVLSVEGRENVTKPRGKHCESVFFFLTPIPEAKKWYLDICSCFFGSMALASFASFSTHESLLIPGSVNWNQTDSNRSQRVLWRILCTIYVRLLSFRVAYAMSSLDICCLPPFKIPDMAVHQSLYPSTSLKHILALKTCDDSCLMIQFDRFGMSIAHIDAFIFHMLYPSKNVDFCRQTWWLFANLR